MNDLNIPGIGKENNTNINIGTTVIQGLEPHNYEGVGVREEHLSYTPIKKSRYRFPKLLVPNIKKLFNQDDR